MCDNTLIDGEDAAEKTGKTGTESQMNFDLINIEFNEQLKAGSLVFIEKKRGSGKYCFMSTVYSMDFEGVRYTIEQNRDANGKVLYLSILKKEEI